MEGAHWYDRFIICLIDCARVYLLAETWGCTIIILPFSLDTEAPIELC